MRVYYRCCCVTLRARERARHVSRCSVVVRSHRVRILQHASLERNRVHDAARVTKRTRTTADITRTRYGWFPLRGRGRRSEFVRDAIDSMRTGNIRYERKYDTLVYGRRLVGVIGFLTKTYRV